MGGEKSEQEKVGLPDNLKPDETGSALVTKYSSGAVSGNRLVRIRYQLLNTIDDVKDLATQALNWELERGLSFNLLPVFLAIGIVVYFLAPQEPFLAVLVISSGGLVLTAAKIKHHGRAYFFTTALAATAVGMLAGKLSVIQTHTPQIERQITAVVTGVVLSVDQNRRGSPRMILRPINIEGVPAERLPRKIRLSSPSRNTQYTPGVKIQGLARLQPVSGPVFPGSYDFSFHAWFSGVGGSGFFMGKPNIVANHADISAIEHGVVLVNQTRDAIETRIVEAMPGVSGDIAVALITGDKSRIPEDVQSSLRNTGLAHILAISGLHMALVTLTLVALTRFSFSLFPNVVLRYPVKKWAVCAGFAGATLYLFLSGAGIATQRAWIMISIMLFAVLMDKRAITMRSVAVAASIILVISPESIFAPGFQMSFAAVASLVAGYEFLNTRRKERVEDTFTPGQFSILSNLSRGVGGYISGLVTTSLIAGLATAFVAAWHFNQVAPLGLLANALAMPIAGFVIMPFALFSMLLMPYGLEGIALWPVGHGISWVVDIASWVDGLSPASVTGIIPVKSLAVFGCFLSILTLFRTRLRLLCVVPILAAAPFLKSSVMPEVMISENGRAIAIEDQSGELSLLYPKRNAFVTNIWAKAWSAGRIKTLDLPKEQCNSERCIVVLPSSQILHVVYNPELLRSSCNRADILIAPRLWWVNCRERKPKLILKRYDFEQYGSHAIWIEKHNEKVQPGYKYRVNTGLRKSSRPWGRNVRSVDEVSDIGG